jgi:hypothetical protein
MAIIANEPLNWQIEMETLVQASAGCDPSLYYIFDLHLTLYVQSSQSKYEGNISSMDSCRYEGEIIRFSSQTLEILKSLKPQ